MTQKIKNPPRFSTLLEVWHFKCNHRHHIPQKHHCNLAMLRGCSKETLLCYLQSGHRLKQNAMLKLAQTCSKEFLPFLRNTPKNITDILHQRFNAEDLLKAGIRISSEHISQLMASGKINTIAEHIRLIDFCNNDVILLLQIKNKALSTAYLKTSPRLSEEAEKMLLSYDDEVLDIYFEYCIPSDFMRQLVIQSGTPKFFEQMLKYSGNFLTFEEFKMLVDGGNLEKFALYADTYDICDNDRISYICDNAADAIFEHCIKNGVFSLSSSKEYNRLFTPKFRSLLLEYVGKYPVCSAEVEIKILQSNDDELIKLYCMQSDKILHEETARWILANRLQGKYKISDKSIPTRKWQIETLIFTSGDVELIEQYLFAGDAYTDGLTWFGEAQLFLHAPVNILDKYMEENGVCDFAQKAIIIRWDSALLSLFFDKHYQSFNDENSVAYLAKADTAAALDYLQKMENPDNFLCDYPEVLTELCARKERAVYEFILKKNFLLSEEECIAFIKNAPVELIYRFLHSGNELCNTADIELLHHPDKDLVIHYLKHFRLSSKAEEVLLAHFDLDFINAYGAENFSDYLN